MLANENQFLSVIITHSYIKVKYFSFINSNYEVSFELDRGSL